jgi:hypothetical protein
MIIGHVGVAFWARGRRQPVALGWLLGATFAPDLLRWALEAAGYPWPIASRYSHLLPWCLVLAGALGGLAGLLYRDRRAAAVVAGVILSHVALDLISGFKEAWLGGPDGLGLERYQQLEFAIEAVILWLGWRAMRRAGPASWAASRSVFASLLVVQAVYLTRTFTERPYATRCIEYPLRPCWIRRRDPPPPGWVRTSVVETTSPAHA